MSTSEPISVSNKRKVDGISVSGTSLGIEEETNLHATRRLVEAMAETMERRLMEAMDGRFKAMDERLEAMERRLMQAEQKLRRLFRDTGYGYETPSDTDDSDPYSSPIYYTSDDLDSYSTPIYSPTIY